MKYLEKATSFGSKISFIRIVIAISMLLTITSCSRLLYGPQEQDTTYFAPNFYNNKIIAIRSTLGPEEDVGSGRSTYEYVILLNETVTEENTLFRMTVGGVGGEDAVQLEISPSFTFVGILSGSMVDIYNNAKEVEPYGRDPSKTIYTCDLSSHLPTSFKFSPDETRLAISFGNNKFIITDLQGAGTKEYTVGGNFIWKNNNEGFFYKKDVSRLASIDLNNGTIATYPVDIVPMTYNASADEIYSLSGNTFEVYKLGSTEVARKTLNFDPVKYIRPNISSDGKKVVMCTTPYILPNGTSYEAGGIYLIDVDENKLKEIRYYTDEKIIPTKN